MDTITSGKEKSISDTVEQWLKEDGISITSMDNQNADFYMKVSLSNIPIGVYKLKNRKDSIVVSGGVGFSGNDKQKILSHPELKKILHEITLKYLEKEMEYAFRPNPNEVSRIEIYQLIHFDGLTKHELMRTLVRVRNMLLFTIEKLRYDASVSDQKTKKLRFTEKPPKVVSSGCCLRY